MGQLFYGNAIAPIEMPDRLLAHIKVLAATKLRRSESFTLTLKHAPGRGGRETIWLQPAIPLRFVFDSPENEKLDSNLLTEMAKAASSSAGLTVDLDAEESAEAAGIRAGERRELAAAA